MADYEFTVVIEKDEDGRVKSEDYISLHLHIKQLPILDLHDSFVHPFH